jgi:meso-butanediol dehydrogenase/(S,S)-butanediol dehydrogenase/diacetyl reductase
MGIAPGRAVLVTGAASGFGREVSRRLIDADARVLGLDLSGEALGATADTLGDRFIPHVADVTDAAAVSNAVTAAVDSFGGLDTLIVSAGVIHIKPLAEVTEADWDRTLDVNLKGAFLAMQAVAPHIATAGERGRIVAISSDAGKRGFSWITAYSASKFGLIGLVESVAVELASSGATVNAVCPVGTPGTGMGRQVTDMKARASGRDADEVMAMAARTNPLGRNATEADVASAIDFLLSDEAGFMTGNAIDVDGGAHLGYLPGT